MHLALRRQPPPIGVVLAGGAGARLGGQKATVSLGGRPLIAYPLQALRRALRDVVVLVKAETTLPDLDGVPVWVEPDEPRHPLVGLVHALRLAGGRPVFVCAADLPFVTTALIGDLCDASRAAHRPAVAASRGRMQPLIGCYPYAALGLLESAEHPEGPLRATVMSLAPRLVEVGDAELLFNVNTPDDLLRAAALLDRRRQLSRR